MIKDIFAFLFAVSPLLIRIWYVLYINPPIDPITDNALDDLDTNFGFMSKTFYMKPANDQNTISEFVIKTILLILIFVIGRHFIRIWSTALNAFPGGARGFWNFFSLSLLMD